LALAVAGLSLAGPAGAATYFNAIIPEGQYQVFSIRYEGPPPPTIDGLTTTYVYAQQLGQPKSLWDLFYMAPSCALDPAGVTTCPMFPATVTAITWDNYINLYIEFPHKSVDNCSTEPSNHCAIEYRPLWVSLPITFSGEERTYEILSQSSGAVPEPATWAMMIAGFGLAGAALRRRRLEIA
jgi:hypothetical protein